MNSLIADLVAGSGSASSRLHDQLARLRATGDDGDLIDELAATAKHSPMAMETLLEAIQRHRMAQPAIRTVIVNESDVEEVEQSTMAVVALKLDRFRGDSRFTTWLYSVARNEALMVVRARSRRPEVAHETVPDTGYLGRLSTLVSDREVIDRALARLPAPYRETLVLREVDQLEYEEIAERLGIAVGTVRSRLHKARSLVARQLHELDAAGG